MMISFLVLIFLVFALSIYGGRLLFPRLNSDGTLIALSSRILLGFALIICSMNVLMRFFPGLQSSWVVLLLLFALFALSATHRSLRLDLGDKWGLTLSLLLAIFIILWRIFPAIQIGALVPFEGTSVHDDLWYVFTADWLLDNRLDQRPPVDPNYPLSYVGNINLDGLPRVGSESLIVFFAAISGLGVEQVYPALFVVASVLFCFVAAQGFVYSAKGNLPFLFGGLVLVSLSPVALYIFGNQNFATLWGLLFLGGYYWNLVSVLGKRGARSELLATGVFLGGLLATYPELLAVAVPATAFVVFQALFYYKIAFFRAIKAVSIISCVAALVVPFAVLDALRVLFTAGSASLGENIFFENLFTSMTLGDAIFQIVTFSGELSIVEFNIYVAILGSFSFLIVGLISPKKVWLDTAGLFFACLFVLFLFWLKGYGYGGMKAIEFLSLPLATLIGSGVGVYLSKFKSNFLSGPSKKNAAFSKALEVGVSGAAVITTFLLILVVSVLRTIEFGQVGKSKYLTEDLQDLRRLKNILEPQDVIMISPEFGPNRFMASRWVAYVLSDVPIVYHSSLHGGGYIYGLDQNYDERLRMVTHLLRSNVSSDGTNSNAIFNNASYEVVPISSIPFFLGDGFYQRESWGRWMSQTAKINLNGSCERVLRIQFDHRFSGSVGEDSVLLSTNNKESRYSLNGGSAEIHFPLESGDNWVKIHSLSKGVSPKELGISNDARKLTYAIGNIELDVCVSSS